MKKICFIAPYAALADMAAEAVREKGLDNIAVHQCPIQESVAFARAAQQKGAQILISRGGAATVRSDVSDVWEVPDVLTVVAVIAC